MAFSLTLFESSVIQNNHLICVLCLSVSSVASLSSCPPPPMPAGLVTPILSAVDGVQSPANVKISAMRVGSKPNLWNKSDSTKSASSKLRLEATDYAEMEKLFAVDLSKSNTDNSVIDAKDGSASERRKKLEGVSKLNNIVHCFWYACRMH